MKTENFWIIVLYVLTGTGLYGGYRGWDTPLRLLYFCVFPAHWMLFRFWNWQQEKPEDADRVLMVIADFLGGAFEIFGGVVMWILLYLFLLWLNSQ